MAVGGSMSSPTHALFDVNGKIVVITGSTRGIGRQLAEGFVAAGARVWIHGRSPERCRTLAGELGTDWVAGDFAEPEQVETVVRSLRSRVNHIDVLINNAGVEIIRAIDHIDDPLLSKVFQVNVHACVRLVQGWLDLLAASGAASVINITSIHQEVPYPHNAVYSMSKAALAMFTKTASVELAPRGIRVNNLAPGAIETEINREVLDRIGRDKFAEWIPAGRVGSTREMIGACLFLASPASGYVNGATLFADGGYMQHLVRYVPEE